MRPHRLEKLASLVRAVVSDAIANKLNDPRVSRFASVTRVEVAGDLSRAKVFISVMGTPAEERCTMSALAHAAGHVQRLLARRLETRQCPELCFIADPSLKVAAETMRVLREVLPHDPAAAPAGADENSFDESGDDQALDMDGPPA